MMFMMPSRLEVAATAVGLLPSASMLEVSQTIWFESTRFPWPPLNFDALRYKIGLAVPFVDWSC